MSRHTFRAFYFFLDAPIIKLPNVNHDLMIQSHAAELSAPLYCQGHKTYSEVSEYVYSSKV